MTYEESVARHPSTFVERMREKHGITHVPDIPDPEPSELEKLIAREAGWWSEDDYTGRTS